MPFSPPDAVPVMPAAGWRSPYLAWAVMLGLLVLRWGLIKASPLLPVELQQAHLAWSWNQGRLPYRDVMDLYPPLLGWWQRLVIGWVGPQAWVMTGLREAALGWYGLSLYALWSIGRRLYGAGTGLAAMLLVGLYPPLFAAMGQAGIDGMWCGLSLGALALMVSAGPEGNRHRVWLAGVLAGLALCLCLQMAWLLSLVAVAAVAVALRRLGERTLPSMRRLGWMLFGLLLAPGICLSWVLRHGDWPAMAAWLWDEALSEDGLASGWRLVGCMMLALAGMAGLCWRWRSIDDDGRAVWRLMLALCSWLGLTMVLLAWPWYGRPDFMPLVAVSGLLIFGEMARWTVWRGLRGPLACGLLLLSELACIGWALPPGRDALRSHREMLAAVLRYSAPGDRVMDASGAAVFRQRPYYPLLDSPQAWQAGRRAWSDAVANELVRHATHLVMRQSLPPLSDSFVARNYLPLQGQLYVAGRVLAAAPAGAERPLRLELPGDYTLTDGVKAIPAAMDGEPAATHWHLEAGMHYLQLPGDEPLLLLDSRAWGAGWRPGPVASGRW